MSESHELYKKYRDKQRKVSYAKRTGSNYVEDYEKDAHIAKLEYEAKERQEENSRQRTDQLFGNIY